MICGVILITRMLFTYLICFLGIISTLKDFLPKKEKKIDKLLGTELTFITMFIMFRNNQRHIEHTYTCRYKVAIYLSAYLERFGWQNQSRHDWQYRTLLSL